MAESVPVVMVSVQDMERELSNRGIDNASIQLLKDNDITPESLKELSKSDLSSIGFKLGPNIMLLNVIKQLFSKVPSQHLNEAEQPIQQPRCHVEELASTGSLVVPTTGHNAVLVASSVTNLDLNIVEQQATSAHFNVPEFLKKTSNGLAILDSFCDNQEKFVSTKDRQEIVRLCVDHLVSLPSGYYPSASQKEAMAAGITTAFPCLAYLEEGVKSPYSHFYDPKSPGFIDQRLKTVRGVLAIEDRKRKSPQNLTQNKKPRKSNSRRGLFPITELEEDQHLKEQHKYEIEWMRSNPGIQQNKARITEFMVSTFQFRQKEHYMLPPTEVFKACPRFVDTDQGRLIFYDFKMKYPKSRCFVTYFVDRYSSSLPRLAEQFGIQSQQSSDGCLTMLLLVLATLPELSKKRKFSYDAKREKLIIFIKENEDIEACLKDIDRGKQGLKQPFIMCQGTAEQPVSFSLIVEDEVIYCGSQCSNAFQNLFAVFFVFQLTYPPMLVPFYRFFEEGIFQISPNNASTTDYLRMLGRCN